MNTGTLNVPRNGHTATELENGLVLVVGGKSSNGTVVASAELYDPATGKWTITGEMANARTNHTATLLTDGDVLVAIGIDNPQSPCLATAELYNPSTGKWRTTSSMTTAHFWQGATLLQNGHVLVPTTPDLLSEGDVLIANDHQFYDPTTATWTATGAIPLVSVALTNATILDNGEVLATGSQCKSSKDYSCTPTPVAFLYSVSGNSWSQTGSMNYVASYVTMTLLPSGEVLVAGGNSRGIGALSFAELYTP